MRRAWCRVPAHSTGSILHFGLPGHLVSSDACDAASAHYEVLVLRSVAYQGFCSSRRACSVCLVSPGCLALKVECHQGNAMAIACTLRGRLHALQVLLRHAAAPHAACMCMQAGGGAVRADSRRARAAAPAHARAARPAPGLRGRLARLLQACTCCCSACCR